MNSYFIKLTKSSGECRLDYNGRMNECPHLVTHFMYTLLNLTITYLLMIKIAPQQERARYTPKKFKIALVLNFKF